MKNESREAERLPKEGGTQRTRALSPSSGTDANLTRDVAAFWNARSCGEIYASGATEAEFYESQGEARYRLEPYIRAFARFQEGRARDILEIGVGMGADHAEWARSQPRSLVGIDLTPRAVWHTGRRLNLIGHPPTVTVADAEHLPFRDSAFDLVYSWGVLHHTPDTQAAVDEVHRVLRPGGTARAMIYHKYSLTGYVLWIRYGLLAGRPWCTLTDIYRQHLESPGTKAYSVRDAQKMFCGFSRVRLRTQLSFGDLLEGAVGQRHQGLLLRVGRTIWPRWLLRRLAKSQGLALLIEATK